jgi:uncharacterized protein YqeY
MSETIKQRIDTDLKNAMRAHDKELVTTLRFIMAGIKQREVDERITLNDDQLIALLDKMARQRRESIEQYNTAGRAELAAKEQAELTIILQYLPQPLTDAEVAQLISQAIAAVEAKDIKDMGKVMAHLKPQIQGRADGTMASKLVKDALSKL